MQLTQPKYLTCWSWPERKRLRGRYNLGKAWGYVSSAGCYKKYLHFWMKHTCKVAPPDQNEIYLKIFDHSAKLLQPGEGGSVSRGSCVSPWWTQQLVFMDLEQWLSTKTQHSMTPRNPNMQPNFMTPCKCSMLLYFLQGFDYWMICSWSWFVVFSRWLWLTEQQLNALAKTPTPSSMAAKPMWTWPIWEPNLGYKVRQL